MSYPSDSRNAARFVPRVGLVVAGKYRIERKLGEGGMGLVVAASHLQLGGQVALKFLVPGEGDRTEAVTRLLREAQSVARIKSDHVARVLDVGTLEGGDPYIVMEMLEGADLHKVLRQRGPLPIAEAVEYVLQAAEAVADAHGAGIVHRDLKPANVFLMQKPDGSPFIKVLDFGIAKSLRTDKEAGEVSLTVGGDVLGSPLYMAPEQIRNPKGVDPRADVWSLGTILYKLLTGRAAFEADNPSASLAMIIAEEPTPLGRLRPDVPPALEAVVHRCLEKRLDRRWQSVDELACALLPFAPPRPRGRPWVPTTGTGSALPNVPVHVPMIAGTGTALLHAPPQPAEMTVRTRRKSAAIVAAVACALVVLGGLVVFGFSQGETAPGVSGSRDLPREPAPSTAPKPMDPPPVAVVETAAPSAVAAPTPSPLPRPTAPVSTKRKTNSDALDDRL